MGRTQPRVHYWRAKGQINEKKAWPSESSKGKKRIALQIFQEELPADDSARRGKESRESRNERTKFYLFNRGGVRESES